MQMVLGTGKAGTETWQMKSEREQKFYFPQNKQGNKPPHTKHTHTNNKTKLQAKYLNSPLQIQIGAAYRSQIWMCRLYAFTQICEA